MKTLFFFTVLSLLPAYAQAADRGIQCFASRQEKTVKERVKNGYTEAAKSQQVAPAPQAAVTPLRQQTLQKLIATVTTLCEQKEAYVKLSASYTAQIQKGHVNAAGCDPFTKEYTPLNGVNNANDAYIRKVHSGGEDYAKVYQQNSKAEADKLKDFAAAAAQTAAANYKQAWGKLPNAPATNLSKDGFFSALIPQINEESDDLRKAGQGFSGTMNKLKAANPTCSVAGLPAPNTTPASANSDISADPKPPAPLTDDKNNISTDDPAKANQDPWKTDPKLAADNASTANEPISPSPTPAASPSDQNLGPAPLTGDGALGNPIGSATDTNTDTLEGSAPGWAARNKGIIIAGVGTAAVVGGVLWYKNNKDKKKDSDSDSYSATPSATATTTSTVTSTNTVVITDKSASISVDSFPSSLTVGQSFTVSVTLLDANGNQVAASGRDVSIACTSACSIAGVLTKKVVAGHVTFSDVHFSSAEPGVQLRITSPGLNSVTSPGSFAVTQ